MSLDIKTIVLAFSVLLGLHGNIDYRGKASSSRHFSSPKKQPQNTWRRERDSNPLKPVK
jgi:hypothetical protein